MFTLHFLLCLLVCDIHSLSSKSDSAYSMPGYAQASSKQDTTALKYMGNDIPASVSLHPNLIWFWERLYSCAPPCITSSPFSHRIRLGLWARESCFAHTLCIYVCVNNYCLPLLQQGLQSELFMQDLNTCKWFTCLSWHRSRLPMATAPSRSSSPPLLLLPLLQSGAHPPTMLSNQWYCFDWCYTRLGGCTLWGGRISHNLKSRSYRQGRMRYGGWTDGRRAESLHPAARTWSSGDDTQ